MQGNPLRGVIAVECWDIPYIVWAVAGGRNFTWNVLWPLSTSGHRSNNQAPERNSTFVLLDIQAMNLPATPLHAANPECDFVATLSNVFETPANGRLFHTKPHGTRLNYYVALCVHS